MPPELGALVARRYRVLKPLGKGGMGEVFSAENIRTGRVVAIKLLRAEAKTKQSAIERFRREARAAGCINSEFVTEVLDVEDDDEHGIVLVFEFLEGESLVERLKRTGPVPFGELWGIVEAVLIGLADAHAAGIVHRDLKPSNVYLEQRRTGPWVKILDFGISKLPKNASVETLTQVGQSLGTFSFMPPEQIGKAKSVDHRADIYACATLVYQAMSGKLPYKARNVVHMMELKRKQEPRTLAEAMKTPVPPGLEAFIAKGLARSPHERYQTAVEALRAWRALRPPGASSIYGSESTHHYEDDGDVATIQLDQSPAAVVEARRLIAMAKRPGVGKTQVIPEEEQSRAIAEVRAAAQAQAEAVGGAESAQQPSTNAQRSANAAHALGAPASFNARRALGGGQAASGSALFSDTAGGQQLSSGAVATAGQPYSGQPAPAPPGTAQRPSTNAVVTQPSTPQARTIAMSFPNTARRLPDDEELDPYGDTRRRPPPHQLAFDEDSAYDDIDRGPSALALVLGGLLLVAVGFVVVALALRYFG